MPESHGEEEMKIISQVDGTVQDRLGMRTAVHKEPGQLLDGRPLIIINLLSPLIARLLLNDVGSLLPPSY